MGFRETSRILALQALTTTGYAPDRRAVRYRVSQYPPRSDRRAPAEDGQHQRADWNAWNYQIGSLTTILGHGHDAGWLDPVLDGWIRHTFGTEQGTGRTRLWEDHLDETGWVARSSTSWPGALNA